MVDTRALILLHEGASNHPELVRDGDIAINILQARGKHIGFAHLRENGHLPFDLLLIEGETILPVASHGLPSLLHDALCPLQSLLPIRLLERADARHIRRAHILKAPEKIIVVMVINLVFLQIFFELNIRLIHWRFVNFWFFLLFLDLLVHETLMFRFWQTLGMLHSFKDYNNLK